MLSVCFTRQKIGPPGLAHGSLTLASRACAAGRLIEFPVASLRQRPHYRSVAASAPLVQGTLGLVTAGRLDSPCWVLPAGHTLAPEVNRPTWIY